MDWFLFDGNLRHKRQNITFLKMVQLPARKAMFTNVMCCYGHVPIRKTTSATTIHQISFHFREQQASD